VSFSARTGAADDRRMGTTTKHLKAVCDGAARFHRGLAAAVVRMARWQSEQQGIGTVALGGGVFQNKVFTELVLRGLQGSGLDVMLPRLVPVNDGGLALGQALIALARGSNTSGSHLNIEETSTCA